VDGRWRIVRCSFEHLIVSTGFLLQKLTAGRVKATQHRVINRNSAERYSTALFLDPNPAAHITPVMPVPAGEEASKYECIAGQKGVRYHVGYSSKPTRAE
jgi:isopenicillin N synthase-like dioxygenase